jgi:2,3-bisphosphoglycerate-dependent phosphoglycerate mutase
MHLYIIRHGQSTNNRLYLETGSDQGRVYDPELSELGQRQAQCLAQFLMSLKNGSSPFFNDIKYLYTSPMVRAVATGLEVARALGLPLVAWKDLHEGGGLFLDDPETGAHAGQPGYDRAGMAARFPELVWPPELGDGPWWDQPFETPEERLPRARRVLEELLARHTPAAGESNPDEGVAFFTHANFYNYFLAALLGFSERRPAVWFSLLNTGVTRIDFYSEREPFIAYQNRVDHLPPELITG